MSWNIKTPGDYINGPLTVAGTATITGDLTVTGNGLFTGTGFVALQRPLIPVGENGTTALSFRWYSTGTTYVTGASVTASSEAAWTVSSTPARLMFSTVPSGSTTLVERYRIGQDGTSTWSVAGTTAMTLNSYGLGVGLVPINGNGKFQVLGGLGYDGQFDLISQFSNVTTASAKGVLIGYNNTTNNGIIAAAYGNGTEGLQFWTHNGSSWGSRMTLGATGNLAFPTGKGIDFSAVTGGTGTATANTLNDYEEGTWTPVLRGVTTAGSYTFSYGVGKYTKIGRLVMLSVSFVDVTQVTAGSGAIQITGLPFTLPNDDPGARGVVGELLIRQCNALSTAKNMYVQGSGGSAVVYFNYFNGTDDVNIDVSAIISGQTDFGFTLNYNV
jgi:hypothetical protein